MNTNETTGTNETTNWQEITQLAARFKSRVEQITAEKHAAVPSNLDKSLRTGDDSRFYAEAWNEASAEMPAERRAWNIHNDEIKTTIHAYPGDVEYELQKYSHLPAWTKIRVWEGNATLDFALNPSGAWEQI